MYQVIIYLRLKKYLELENNAQDYAAQNVANPIQLDDNVYGWFDLLLKASKNCI